MQIARSGLEIGHVADLGIGGVAQALHEHEWPCIRSRVAISSGQDLEPPAEGWAYDFRRNIFGDPNDESIAIVWRDDGDGDARYNMLSFDKLGPLYWAQNLRQATWLESPCPWSLVPQFLSHAGFSLSEPADLLITRFRGVKEAAELLRLASLDPPDGSVP
jgi:hypothetical protein